MTKHQFIFYEVLTLAAFHQLVAQLDLRYSGLNILEFGSTIFAQRIPEVEETWEFVITEREGSEPDIDEVRVTLNYDSEEHTFKFLVVRNETTGNLVFVPEIHEISRFQRQPLSRKRSLMKEYWNQHWPSQYKYR